MLKQFVRVFLLMILFFHQANAQSYQRISREEANNYLLKNNNYSIQNFSYDEIKKINPSFYIGFDYSYNKLKYKDSVMKYSERFSDKGNNYSFILGTKFNNFIGIEFFYQNLKGKNNSYNSYIVEYNSNLEYKAYGLDFLSFMPVNKYLDYIVSIGLAKYDIKDNIKIYNNIVDVLHKTKKNYDAFGLRIGTGVGINITDDLSLRLIAKFIKMTTSDVIDNMFEYSLGFRYKF
jgi:opacity protein-like surface antigen